MSDNSHNMTTRSKNTEEINSSEEVSFDDSESDVDDNGNLEGFIDYDDDGEDFDQKEFDNLIKGLSGPRYHSNDHKVMGTYQRSNKVPKKKIKKQNRKKLNEVFMTYLIMKATENANKDIKSKSKRPKNSKSKIKVSEITVNPVEEIDLDIPNSKDDGKFITILEYQRRYILFHSSVLF